MKGLVMSFNKSSIEVFGNLTRNPEMRHTSGGTAVCELPLAINDGPDPSEVTFITVKAWKGWAENIMKTAKKGSLIYAKGKFRTESWQDKKTEEKKSRIVVAAERAIHFQQPRNSSTEEPQVQESING